MNILPIINKSLENYMFSREFEFWMIVNKSNLHVIGDIVFHRKPNEKGEVKVGFRLIEQERGKGFGFESLKAILHWLNYQENVKVIKASCLISNKPYAGILEKAGMNEINKDQDLIY